MRLRAPTEEGVVVDFKDRGCPDRIEMDYPEWLALSSAIIILALTLVVAVVVFTFLG